MTEIKHESESGFDPTQVHQVSDIAQQLPGVTGSDTTVEAGLELEARSQWSYARRRFLRHRLAMTGLVILIIVFGSGIFANYIAPYSFDQIDLTRVLQGPTSDANHFFGTDQIGRDYFSRVIFGIR